MRKHQFVYLLASGILIHGCSEITDSARIEDARAQVERIVTKLDQQTTDTGAYIRVEKKDFDETDPWGTKIDVSYSQGGLAEAVHVRSAGPDQKFHTADDIFQERVAANMKGVGENIKDGVGDVAQEAAKGAVKGTIDGVKESIKESLPFGKKDKNKDAKTDEPENDDAK